MQSRPNTHGTRNLFLGKILISLLLLGATACVDSGSPASYPRPKSSPQTEPPEKGAESDPKPKNPSPPVLIEGPNARELCTRPKSIAKNPETFDDVVKLLNALPKPVSVPCFLDTLEPPFYINATDNLFSGQPAGGPHAPRIFLFFNKLLISVVPEGTGAPMVELSYRVGDEESIKGEIPFPIQENISLETPYTHILSREKTQTLCVACHFPEKPAPSNFPKTAFVSRWVKAIDDYDVPIEKLKILNDKCKSQRGEHCAIIQSLFRRGEVFPKSFDP